MPPEIMLIKKTRWVWILLLALSPLAYMLGASLIFKYDPNLNAGFTIDRKSAIEAAARFAVSKGIDVTGWDSLCRVGYTNDLLFYYRLDKGKESQIARSLAPEVVVDIRFKSPDHLESLEVELGPDGRALGYTRNFSEQRQAGATPEPAARQLAAEAVKSRLAQEGITSDVDLKLDENARTGAVLRKYVWKWPLTTIPELTVNSEVSFRGDVLVSDRVKVDIDSTFAKSKLHGGSVLKIVFIIAYGLLIAFVLSFSIYRFVQRVKQKEISSSRIALVTVVFASVLTIYILLTDMAIYDVAGATDIPVPNWLLTLIIYFSSIMLYSVGGLFMGVAYGSGEGDIRESYPGKLTSLDTLITGHFFSQNVSRAFLIGCAIGGWVLW